MGPATCLGHGSRVAEWLASSFTRGRDRMPTANPPIKAWRIFRRSKTTARRRTASLSSDSFMMSCGEFQDRMPFESFFFLGKQIDLIGAARQHPQGLIILKATSQHSDLFFGRQCPESGRILGDHVGVIRKSNRQVHNNHLSQSSVYSMRSRWPIARWDRGFPKRACIEPAAPARDSGVVPYLRGGLNRRSFSKNLRIPSNQAHRRE
jgi:hypothetical protein